MNAKSDQFSKVKKIQMKTKPKSEKKTSTVAKPAPKKRPEGVVKVRVVKPEEVVRPKTLMEGLDELLGTMSDYESRPDAVDVPENAFDKRTQFEKDWDAMIASGGIPANELVEQEEPEPTFIEHRWENDADHRSTMIYSTDRIRLRCRVCFRAIDLDREETLGVAMERHGVNTSCGTSLAESIMTE